MSESIARVRFRSLSVNWCNHLVTARSIERDGVRGCRRGMRRLNNKDTGKLTGFNAACAKFVRREFTDEEAPKPAPRTKKKLATASSRDDKGKKGAKRGVKSAEIDIPMGLLDSEDTAQLELEHAFFGWLHDDGGAPEDISLNEEDAFLDNPLEDELCIFSGNLDENAHTASVCFIDTEETLKSPAITPPKDQALIKRGRRRRGRSSLEFQSLLESIADIPPETDRTQSLM